MARDRNPLPLIVLKRICLETNATKPEVLDGVSVGGTAILNRLFREAKEPPFSMIECR